MIKVRQFASNARDEQISLMKLPLQDRRWPRYPYSPPRRSTPPRPKALRDGRAWHANQPIHHGPSETKEESARRGQSVWGGVPSTWLDNIRTLQTQVFSIDTPSQRQQLFLGDKLLEDDGRVLAQHGVVAESTIQLVSVVELSVIHAVGAMKRTENVLL